MIQNFVSVRRYRLVVSLGFVFFRFVLGSPSLRYFEVVFLWYFVMCVCQIPRYSSAVEFALYVDTSDFMSVGALVLGCCRVVTIEKLRCRLRHSGATEYRESLHCSVSWSKSSVTACCPHLWPRGRLRASGAMESLMIPDFARPPFLRSRVLACPSCR